MTALGAVDRWRTDAAGFIEAVLHDPETGEPFKLTKAERRFLLHAFKLTSDGRLRYPELVFSAPKKSGKTTLAAMLQLYVVLVLGGRFAEGICVANDLEQALVLARLSADQAYTGKQVTGSRFRSFDDSAPHGGV